MRNDELFSLCTAWLGSSREARKHCRKHRECQARASAAHRRRLGAPPPSSSSLPVLVASHPPPLGSGAPCATMALHLPAHSLSDAPPSPVTGVHLNADGSVFATSTTEGWVVYRTQPLEVLTRRGALYSLSLSGPGPTTADSSHRDRPPRRLAPHRPPPRALQPSLPRRRAPLPALPAQQGRPVGRARPAARRRARVPRGRARAQGEEGPARRRAQEEGRPLRARRGRCRHLEGGRVRDVRQPTRCAPSPTSSPSCPTFSCALSHTKRCFLRSLTHSHSSHRSRCPRHRPSLDPPRLPRPPTRPSPARPPPAALPAGRRPSPPSSALPRPDRRATPRDVGPPRAREPARRARDERRRARARDGLGPRHARPHLGRRAALISSTSRHGRGRRSRRRGRDARARAAPRDRQRRDL